MNRNNECSRPSSKPRAYRKKRERERERERSSPVQNATENPPKKLKKSYVIVLTILGAMMPANVTIFSGGGPVLCLQI